MLSGRIEHGDRPEGEGAIEPDLFESLVDGAEEGVVVLRRDRVVCYTNGAAEFLLGCPRVNLLGEMFGVPVLPTQTPVRLNAVSADGRMRLIELRVEPLPNDRNGLTVVRIQDITTYHQDAAAAREEVRRRDDFMAMLSHELRNPLAAIHYAASLLARDDLSPQSRQSNAEMFERQFSHLRRVLDDLLDLSRITRGKLRTVNERVDFSQVVRDGVEAVGPLVARSGHTLLTNIPAVAVWVWGDATRLEQVVVNLLNNAIKFTPPDGGWVEVAVAAAGEEVELVVRDNGPGVPEELRPYVFEPFVQGKQDVARTEGGLGIGLTLVNAIAALHGGTVTLGSAADGRGAVFTVRLPLVAAADPDDSPPPPVPAARPGRVLLVEDGADARRMLKELLRLEGYDVIEAGDGPAGLAAILEQRPDVALVDIGLPGFDGYELARRVRSGGGGQATRLIAVTGYGMPQDVGAAFAAGFDGHVVKPVRFPDLRRLLETPAADPTGRYVRPGGDEEAVRP